ncbi:MAG TPA: tRNA (N6-threonylcarbamoyladenosine(37)-N6)-methyltransferase TrmO [Terriglobia bacterium]|nr:tRNA (N6-threonylcarbamoyladenosine(37)-N6)-methyltransferase TrmO [Terriglobia bacterium]
MFTFQPIGYIRSPYFETTEVPRGPGTQHHAEGVLEIAPEFEQGLMDIEGFSHLFVIWVFDRSEGYALTGVPPTDDRPHGVFATRSPYRPNPIGLTVVEVLGREGCKVCVRGIDMLDETPILDIKPYMSGIPTEKLRLGWFAEAEARRAKSS